MENLERLTTVGTHDTGRRQTKHNNTTEHRKLKKDEQHGLHKNWG